MAAKKKELEPIRIYKHPVIPADNQEQLYGKTLVWIDEGNFVDWDMKPQAEDVGMKYKEEYRDKIVVVECSTDVSSASNPVYFTKDGLGMETLGWLALEFHYEYIKTAKCAMNQAEAARKALGPANKKAKDAEVKLTKVTEELEGVNATLGLVIDQLESKNEECNAIQAELKDMQTMPVMANNEGSLSAAIGGTPKEVNIKW